MKNPSATPRTECVCVWRVKTSPVAIIIRLTDLAPSSATKAIVSSGDRIIWPGLLKNAFDPKPSEYGVEDPAGFPARRDEVALSPDKSSLRTLLPVDSTTKAKVFLDEMAILSGLLKRVDVPGPLTYPDIEGVPANVITVPFMNTLATRCVKPSHTSA
jgi:hypothetical protein